MTAPTAAPVAEPMSGITEAIAPPTSAPAAASLTIGWSVAPLASLPVCSATSLPIDLAFSSAILRSSASTLPSPLRSVSEVIAVWLILFALPATFVAVETIEAFARLSLSVIVVI